MILLDVLFIAVCAYLFGAWQVAEKHLQGNESKKELFFMYYLWPVFLMKSSHRQTRHNAIAR